MEAQNQQKNMHHREMLFSGILFLVFLFATVSETMGQVGSLTNTGDMTVCLSSDESYGVMPAQGSTYTWSIIAGTGGAGNISSLATTNLISINWTGSGTCTLRVIESNSNCTGLPVDILITVLPALIPGITSADQNICYNDVPTLLTSTAPGGIAGPYTYQWEISTNNGITWTAVPGANSLTYQPGGLTQNTMYHLKQSANGGCGEVTTNNLTVNVQSQLMTSPIYHN